MIYQKLFDSQVIEEMSQAFLKAYPFRYLVIDNFLEEKSYASIEHAVSNEIVFERKESDLFAFGQSSDMVCLNNPVMVKLKEMLCDTTCRNFLQMVTGIDVGNHIDFSVTEYTYTDHLLCHDDQLEDRKLAFLLYCSTLTSNEGGALELFENKNGRVGEKVVDILPYANRLVLFEVSPISFHQVAEVIGKDARRLTVGGWYHEAN